MLVCFDKRGALKEQLDSYGNLPRVNSQNFKIIAYFKDINIENYGAAYIRLQRPDLDDSEYPILFMTRANLNYNPSVIAPGTSQYFNQGSNPYPCYVFDFSSVKNDMGTYGDPSDDTIVTLLNIPGQWKATITLVNTSNSNATNVVGVISFNVGGTETGEETEAVLPDGVITYNVALVLAQKLNTDSAYYLRTIDGFEAKAAAGELPKGFFVAGTVVFDRTNKTFYRINSVEPVYEEGEVPVIDETDYDYVSCDDYTIIIVLGDEYDLRNYVPYSGATRNVNLGTNELYFADEDGAAGIYIEDANLKLSSTDGNIILNPDGIAQYGSYEIATKHDLESYAQLDRFVTFSEVGIRNHDSEEITPYISIYAAEDAQGFIFGNNLDADETFAVLPITNHDEIIAYESKLPSKSVCATFNTGDFIANEGDGHYYLEDIAISNFINGSEMLIITWDNCFALCPIPQSGAGRVVAAMWNDNGEAQTIRIRYELKDNNTKLDINLQGGFIPPGNHTGYVFCYRLIS